MMPYFAVDLAIARAIQSFEAPWLDALLRAVTWVGMPPQVTAVFGAIVVGLFVLGLRIEALLTLCAALSGAGLWYVMTGIVERPRPSPELVHVVEALPHSSFPSGHVLNLTAIFGFLFYLAFVYLEAGWTRRLVLAVCALPVVTIGIARVREGAHWPSDVLGGYLLGIVLLAVTIDLYRRARERSGDRNGQPVSHELAKMALVERQDRVDPGGSRARGDHRVVHPTAEYAIGGGLAKEGNVSVAVQGDDRTTRDEAVIDHCNCIVGSNAHRKRQARQDRIGFDKRRGSDYHALAPPNVLP